MDKISIIIPCYNGEHVIERSVGSVLAQTYGNFELIVVNDGSDDKTAEKLKRFSESDDRIKIIEKENGGVSSARNLGLKNATGDFIEFMDADDELMPQAFEKLIEAIKRTGADCAACNFSGNPMFMSYLPDRVFDFSNSEDVLFFYQETHGAQMPWNKLYRRSVITEPFDEDEHFSEDDLFNLANLKNMKKLVALSDVLYIYHFAPAENLTSTSAIGKLAEHAFWKDKTSFWYLGDRLLPKRRRAVESGIKKGKLGIKDADEIACARVFDYLIAEISAYAYAGIDKKHIVTETCNVSVEPDFIRSLEVLERYGTSYDIPVGDEIKDKAEKYVDACYKIHSAVMAGESKLDFTKVFYKLFVKVYMKKNENPLNRNEILARNMAELEENATPEDEYVNALAL